MNRMKLVAIGGFPIEIKTKIRYFIILILFYETMITTIYMISYFGFNFDLTYSIYFDDSYQGDVPRPKNGKLRSISDIISILE